MAEAKSSEANDKMWMVAFGVVAAVIVLVPTVLGVGLWRLGRSRLVRHEWLLIGATALIVTALTFGSTLSGYFSWLVQVAPPDMALWPLPWLSLLCYSTVIAAVLGAMDGTRTMAKVSEKMHLSHMDADSVLPTDAQRERVRTKVRSTDAEFFAIDADDHTADSHEMGGRSFTLGLDPSGKKPVRISESEIRTHAVLLGATGSGKALALDTPIPTPSGWTTMGELATGDWVFGPDGKPVQVSFATETMYDHECFEVVFSDGSTIIADADHRWLTTAADGSGAAVRTTSEIAGSLMLGGFPNHTIPSTAPLRYRSSTATIDDVVTFLEAFDRRTRIPEMLLRAAPELRAELLDGLLGPGGDSVGVDHPSMATDIAELIAGLGGQSRLVPGGDLSVVEVVAHPREKAAHRVVDVRPHPSVPVRCIQVDSEEHLYLAGESCVITHNTETIKNLAGNLGDLGWSVIVLDLKEDTAPGGLRDFCSTYAKSHALQYQELALSKDHNELWFNPLLGMTLDEAINTIMSLQTFDDGYWQAVNKTMIGQVCTLFYDAHEVDPERFPAPDMYNIGRLLRQQSLPQVTKEMRAIVLASKPDRHPDDFSALAKPSQAETQSASGLGSRIVNMFESQAGRGVLRPGDGREVLDVCAGGFVYVGLNTLGLSELARVVSTSALLRLAAYAGARTTGAHTGPMVPTAVIIDEANWIDRRQVQNLLSRARSAGIAVVLCTQGPDDWNDENGNDWNTITQNTNVSVIMRQGNEFNAEMCAELIGKKAKTSLISQVRDGEVMDSGSQSERIDFVVPTADIRGLRVGEAILKVGVPYERVEYCAVRQRTPDDHTRRQRRR